MTTKLINKTTIDVQKAIHYYLLNNKPRGLMTELLKEVRLQLDDDFTPQRLNRVINSFPLSQSHSLITHQVWAHICKKSKKEQWLEQTETTITN